MAYHIFKKCIVLTGILIWLAMFAGGLIAYPASKLMYTLFSVVFIVVLVSGFYRQVSYGYLFLVIFLWLGFWFKLAIHLIFDYPFVEPVGDFYGAGWPWHQATLISPVSYSARINLAWDEVLWVAIVAGIGVVAGRILYGLAGKKNTTLLQIREEGEVPAWYPAIRKWLWLIVMSITVGFAAVNVIYGIQQAGLIPRSILLWPLNAMVAWMVSIGSAIGVSTLLWWDISLKKNISLSIYAVLAEGFFSTVSLLSRGVYIFHVIPQLLAMYKNRRTLAGVSRNVIILIPIVFIVLFVVSIVGVSALRMGYYSQASGSSKKGLLAEINKSQETASPVSGRMKILFFGQIDKIMFFSKNVLQLASDRWIGFEGVMAVESYPNKGRRAFLEALTEKREIGSTSLYQRVCNSLYQETDNSKFQFASLPGGAAFFYFSGSLWIVMLGMTFFAFLLLLWERFVFIATANPLLCSLLGAAMANSIAQFGLAPRQDGPYYFMVLCGILFIWLLRSRWLIERLKFLSPQIARSRASGK